jgi:hypothetical protein
MTEATILQFTPSDLPTDGGKSRIQRRRDVLFGRTPPQDEEIKRRDNFKFRSFAEPIFDNRDDLMMDHADPGYPSDSPYRAPDTDPA